MGRTIKILAGLALIALGWIIWGQTSAIVLIIVDLIRGVVISLVMISLPTFASARPAALVQLLGPNVMTVAGAAFGALIGPFVPRSPDARHFRAGESPYAMLVAARIQSPAQVPAVLDL